jgi:hypothetical protein
LVPEQSSYCRSCFSWCFSNKTASGEEVSRKKSSQKRKKRKETLKKGKGSN